MFIIRKFNPIKLNTMKAIFIGFVLIITNTNINAQSENKDVTVTSSGSGNTLEAAKQSALRSATEQAFGAFISSKIEMFNDQVVADHMASVSSGNIKSFEILNQDQLPDGRWGVTLKAVVSVDKLTSFVQAKGIKIEVKGGMFALNIKQQLLNEEGEIKAVAEMVGLLHEPMQSSFDYVLKSGDPKSLDAESKNWEIPLVVTAICNKNIDFCANYFIKTLAALSLTLDEVESYKSLNKKVFPVTINYTGQNKTFYLRKQRSIDIINSLIRSWDFYMRLFSVQSGINEFLGSDKRGPVSDIEKALDYQKKWHHPLIWKAAKENVGFDQTLYYNNKQQHFNNQSLSFQTSGDVANTYSWKDKRTLSEIEQMTGYAVKPRGVVSSFKNGGYVVWEKDGKGLVVCLVDIGAFKSDQVDSSCTNFSLNGYNDWKVPSKDELNLLYNFSKLDVGYFQVFYWSSTTANDGQGKIGQAFESISYGMQAGEQSSGKKSLGYVGNGQYIDIYVRPVRTF